MIDKNNNENKKVLITWSDIAFITSFVALGVSIIALIMRITQ